MTQSQENVGTVFLQRTGKFWVQLQQWLNGLLCFRKTRVTMLEKQYEQWGAQNEFYCYGQGYNMVCACVAGAPAGWETGRARRWCCWHTEPSPSWCTSPQRGGCGLTRWSWCLEAPAAAERDHACFSSTFPPTLSTKTRGIYIYKELLTVVKAEVSLYPGVNSYLSTEERLRKTEAVHYVNQVIQCVVEDSVELLPSQSYCLDSRQGPCVQLCL